MGQDSPKQESSHISLNTHAQPVWNMMWLWSDRMDREKNLFIEGMTRSPPQSLWGLSWFLTSTKLGLLLWRQLNGEMSLGYMKVFRSLKKRAKLSTQSKWDTERQNLYQRKEEITPKKQQNQQKPPWALKAQVFILLELKVEIMYILLHSWYW